MLLGISSCWINGKLLIIASKSGICTSFSLSISTLSGILIICLGNKLKISSLIAYNENINYDFLDNHNTIKVLGIKTKNAKDCLDNVRIEYLNTLILKDFGVNITKHDINLSNILRNFPNIIALNGESINKYPDYQQISRNIKLEKILAF